MLAERALQTLENTQFKKTPANRPKKKKQIKKTSLSVCTTQPIRQTRWKHIKHNQIDKCAANTHTTEPNTETHCK